jgi:hypothetical protein
VAGEFPRGVEKDHVGGQGPDIDPGEERPARRHSGRIP